MMLSVSIRHQLSGFTLDARFSAPAGVTALFGRSGAGKTTIINAVAGLLRPQQGRIEIDGLVLSDSESGRFLPPHRRGLGYVFQEARLFPHLNVRQNLLYGRWFSRARAAAQGDADLDHIVQMLGIGALLGRRPAALSGGERQRVALGRAILSRPRILLMDEPLAALDEGRKAEIMPYLERLRDETRIPILLVSHAPAEVTRLATTVVLIDAGRVVASGPAQAILSDPASAPISGRAGTGAFLPARIEAQEEDGLTRLATPAGPVWLPRIEAPLGAPLRLHVPAHQVTLARHLPTDISALNSFQVTIRDLQPAGPSDMLLRLVVADQTLLARITRRSARLMDLAPGQQVHALLKAVAIAPDAAQYPPEPAPGGQS